MTEISFHTGVTDPLGYACRLVRKAYRQGAKIAVAAEAQLLQQLDQALWTFDPQDFIPHVLLRAGREAVPRHAPTPVWLIASGAHSPVHDVLLNLGPELVQGFETWQRVVEIVARDEADVHAGRQRFRYYKERGYKVVHHEAVEAGNSGSPPATESNPG